MTRPQRSTTAGSAYLDLQRLAKRSGRSMQALLPMFASERWLARLAASRHRHRFIRKGGVLLAALENRRATQDADLLAVDIVNDHQRVINLVNEIAVIDMADGIDFDTSTTTAVTIRESDLYFGVRLSMDCALATARIKLKLDINFGDPVTPGPEPISLPTLLAESPIPILGYPITTVLAEKLSTAIQLGQANTRLRDFVDLYQLTAAHAVEFQRARDALYATARFRAINLRPLSIAVGELATIRAGAYRTYRTQLGIDGSNLPDSLTEVITGVSAYADPLLGDAHWDSWNPVSREWTRVTSTVQR